MTDGAATTDGAETTDNAAATGEPVGVVDIGSTSVRLLVTDGGGEWERWAVVTGLGDGLGDGGSFDRARRDATLESLGRAADALTTHGVAPQRRAVYATSALRRATDGGAFLDRVETLFGTRPQVLAGEDEARLAFRGATSGRDPAGGPFVVVDLGGGSCEFALADDARSAEFGAARLTDAWIHHDPPRPEELVACLSIVEAHLDEVRRAMPGLDDVRTWLGLAGTFTTFAAVEQGLIVYDPDRVDGFVLTRGAAEDVYRTLVTEARQDRRHNPGLAPERVDVILGGACAVVEIFRFFGLERIVVSERDLLDGAAAELLGLPLD